MIYRNDTHWFEVQEREAKRVGVDENGGDVVVVDRHCVISAWCFVEGGSRQVCVYDAVAGQMFIETTGCLEAILPYIRAIEEGRVEETDLENLPPAPSQGGGVKREAP